MRRAKLIKQALIAYDVAAGGIVLALLIAMAFEASRPWASIVLILASGVDQLFRYAESAAARQTGGDDGR